MTRCMLPLVLCLAAGLQAQELSELLPMLRRGAPLAELEALAQRHGVAATRLLLPQLARGDHATTAKKVLSSLDATAMEPLIEALRDPQMAAPAHDALCMQATRTGPPGQPVYDGRRLHGPFLKPGVPVEALVQGWRAYHGMPIGLDQLQKLLDATPYDNLHFTEAALARVAERVLPWLMERILRQGSERPAENWPQRDDWNHTTSHGRSLDILRLRPELGLPALKGALADPDLQAARRAAGALAWFEAPLIWDAALEAAAQRDPWVAKGLAMALGHASPREARSHPFLTIAGLGSGQPSAELLMAFGSARAEALAGLWPKEPHQRSEWYLPLARYGFAPEALDRSFTPQAEPLDWDWAQRPLEDPLLESILAALVPRLAAPEHRERYSVEAWLVRLPKACGPALARTMAALPPSVPWLAVAKAHAPAMIPLRPRLLDALLIHEELAAEALAEQGLFALEDLARSLDAPDPRLRAGCFLALEKLAHGLAKAIAEVVELPYAFYPSGQPHGVHYTVHENLRKEVEAKVRAKRREHPTLHRLLALAERSRRDPDAKVRQRAQALEKAVKEALK